MEQQQRETLHPESGQQQQDGERRLAGDSESVKRQAEEQSPPNTPSTNQGQVGAESKSHSAENPLKSLNIHLQRMAMMVLEVRSGNEQATMAVLDARGRALIPSLSKNKNSTKRLHAEVQRFIDLVATGQWALLEQACQDAIDEFNARVTALRKQCDVELEFDPEFLGAAGCMWWNRRLQHTNVPDDNDDDDDEVYDEDDGEAWCDDDGGVWERDEDDGYDEAWAGE
jgi:hypothetical protein